MSLKVNFSTEEAGSEARSFDPIPRANYLLTISDGELAEVKNPPKPGKTDNRGKPFWRLELSVKEGPYEGRKIWTNVMLFEGALYSLSQLLKSLGYDLDQGEFEVPDLDELIGKDIGAAVKIRPATGDYEASNDVRGFMPADHDSIDNGEEAFAKAQKTVKRTGSATKSSATSLLP